MRILGSGCRVHLYGTVCITMSTHELHVVFWYSLMSELGNVSSDMEGLRRKLEYGAIMPLQDSPSCLIFTLNSLHSVHTNYYYY